MYFVLGFLGFHPSIDISIRSLHLSTKRGQNQNAPIPIEEVVLNFLGSDLSPKESPSRSPIPSISKEQRRRAVGERRIRSRSSADGDNDRFWILFRGSTLPSKRRYEN